MRLSLSKVLAFAIALAFMPSSVSADLPSAGDPSCLMAASYPGMTPFTYCWGSFPGNDSGYESDIIALISGAYPATGTWSYIGKTEAPGSAGPFQMIADEQYMGTLTFDSPVVGPFAIVLKAATRFSIYYWANPGLTGLTSVDFNTFGVNYPTGTDALGNPTTNALSHASLYRGSTNVVPEPSTVILLGTGLLGLFGVEARRRRKKA